MYHDTIMNNFFPGSNIGSVSEQFFQNVRDFIKKDTESESSILTKREIPVPMFRALANVKFLNTLIHPGEAVGCLAA